MVAEGSGTCNFFCAKYFNRNAHVCSCSSLLSQVHPAVSWISAGKFEMRLWSSKTCKTLLPQVVACHQCTITMHKASQNAIYTACELVLSKFLQPHVYLMSHEAYLQAVWSEITGEVAET